jgi:hypothetical protein
MATYRTTSNSNKTHGKVLYDPRHELDYSPRSTAPGCMLVIVLAIVAILLIAFIATL